ncbi:uncharacterized protein LOC117575924 [Drosophila albomicans]|uniref:Uncharacterized protein LOC117575924 n=1 Tax=Drosophila albomicans TaxID=7291 RepID=A0A6P8XSI6_DROAB|nr:uncharacterized protein LOC117575924 [Drosophila albomicans]
MFYRTVLLLFIILLQTISSLDSYSCGELSGGDIAKQHISSLYYRDGNESPEEGGGGCASVKNPIANGDPKTKASNIAQKAAQEARAASDAQMAAAEAAAMQVKSELAERAAQSARAAEAALAGKQQIVEQLQQELCEADAVVSEITASLQNSQANAHMATEAAQEAQNQLNQLKRFVAAATANLVNIENVASGAQQELAEKTQLLEAAKNRLDGLNRQINDAKQDFEKTKNAAYKAACAAVEAKQKAQRNRRLALFIHQLKQPKTRERDLKT